MSEWEGWRLPALVEGVRTADEYEWLMSHHYSDVNSGVTPYGLEVRSAAVVAIQRALMVVNASSPLVRPDNSSRQRLVSEARPIICQTSRRGVAMVSAALGRREGRLHSGQRMRVHFEELLN